MFAKKFLNMSRYESRGTPFFNTPDVAPDPILFDLLHPRYLYNADAEIFVFALVAVPYVVLTSLVI